MPPNKRSPRNSGNAQDLKDYSTTIAILESVQDVILIADVIGHIQYANRSALSLLDTTLEALVGQSIDRYITDCPGDWSDDPEPGQQISSVVQYINKGVLDNIEAGFRAGDQVTPVYLNFNLVQDRKGRVQYIIITAKDITQQKILEKELRQHQLATISRDRLKALGELSVGLVHEISQPLSILRLKLEMLHNQIEKPDHPEKKKQLVHDGYELIDRMAKIIDSMREFSHQTEENLLSAVNVNSVVDMAVNLIQSDFEKRKIEVRVDKDDSLPYILANPLYIEQVLVNLLANVRDAFDDLDYGVLADSERDRFVHVSSLARDGRWVEIHITDNAAGIPDEIVRKIFDPFFSTKKNGRNTGMGLSICKNIVDSMGGDIFVKSWAGKGTEFTLRLPTGHSDERKQLTDLIGMIHHHY
ncbi:MAG: PAS domain-containing protein [Candidatus Marinimicrobia bacterium]|nr:PAS domain-containing protein [Candidatus Neomarinimicrobiota bacterium]MCF7841136.1 PAS domain-containing protein [Candidatus Neomarinimicrobiota bacterium]MCF7902396.1 PAS domain-containing protein [Candidatus Neomarinimicrobiota bacterium]